MPKKREASSELGSGGQRGVQEAQVRYGKPMEPAVTEGPQDLIVQDVAKSLPFVEFMESLGLGDLDVERDRDLGRDVCLGIAE